MEHESDSDSNCSWCTWNDPQRIGTGSWRLGNKRVCRNHRNYSIDEIGQDTKKSTGDLEETYCHSDSSGGPSAKVGVKNSQTSKEKKNLYQSTKKGVAHKSDNVLVVDTFGTVSKGLEKRLG